jgi:hypothetical protein
VATTLRAIRLISTGADSAAALRRQDPR